MKIGILTFHRAKNYGAVLQAYALQNTLSSMGTKCEIIDYRSSKIEEDYKIIQYKKGIKNFIKSCIRMKKNIDLAKRFDHFLERHMDISEKCDKYNINTIKDMYNFFITGSDQVFNSTCAGFDPNYFLEFCDDSKKYSYAASFGDEKLKEELKEEYVKRLNGFKYISCREEKGRNNIQSIIKKETFVHIDPVFLLSKEMWKKMLVPIKYKKYIFVYRVGEPINLFDFAKNLARETECEIVFLDQYMCRPTDGITNVHVASPEEFLSLIANAEFVVTNSFHGTALSIIFEKNFYVELNRITGKNERVSNVLEKFGIYKNEIISKNVDDSKIDIDWEDVKKKLNNEISISKEYLKRIINEKK